MTIEKVSINLDVLGTDEAQIRQVGFGIRGFTLLLESTVTEEEDDTLQVSIVSGGGPVGPTAPEELAEFLTDMAGYIGSEEFKYNWTQRFAELQLAALENAESDDDTGA